MLNKIKKIAMDLDIGLCYTESESGDNRGKYLCFICKCRYEEEEFMVCHIRDEHTDEECLKAAF